MARQDEPVAQVSWLRRAGWLLLIWAGSVLALGVAAGLMRLLMSQLGMAR